MYFAKKTELWRKSGLEPKKSSRAYPYLLKTKKSKPKTKGQYGFVQNKCLRAQLRSQGQYLCGYETKDFMQRLCLKHLKNYFFLKENIYLTFILFKVLRFNFDLKKTIFLLTGLV